MESVILANGLKMPAVGLGTYKARGGEVIQAVSWALTNGGVRHIDTATGYRNEEDVASAIRKAGIPREELFITSKLAPHEVGSPFNSWHIFLAGLKRFQVQSSTQVGDDRARKAFDASLSRLGTSYVDCMLIHWPGAGGLLPADSAHKQARLETWHTLQECYKAGRQAGLNKTEWHLEMKPDWPFVVQVVDCTNTRRKIMNK